MEETRNIRTRPFQGDTFDEDSFVEEAPIYHGIKSHDEIDHDSWQCSQEALDLIAEIEG